jgi:hypothetical protein
VTTDEVAASRFRKSNVCGDTTVVTQIEQMQKSLNRHSEQQAETDIT